MVLYICCTAVDAVAAVILCPCYIYCGPFVAHSINYIHEIYFHQIAFKRLILMLLLNVQPSVKHHRFNRQIHNHLNHFPEPGKCSLSVCVCLCFSYRIFYILSLFLSTFNFDSDWLLLLLLLCVWLLTEREMETCMCFIFVIFLGLKIDNSDASLSRLCCRAHTNRRTQATAAAE